MIKILRGPLPMASMLAVLLGLAYLGRENPQRLPADSGPYFLSGGLGRLLEAFAPGAPGTALLVGGLLVVAVGGFLLLALCYQLTRNRVVSFVAAGLFVLHPALSAEILGSDVLLHGLASALVLGCLLCREQATRRRLEGQPAPRWEYAAFGLFFAACFAGPASLATPLLVLLVDACFRVGTHRESRASSAPRLALYFAVAALAGWLLPPSEAAWSGEVAGSGARFLSLFGLPDWQGGAVTDLFVEAAAVAATAGGLAVVGLAALSLGIRSLERGRPRWLVVYLGFGVAWFLLCELPTGIGLVPVEAAPPLLAFAGLALFVPAVIWRLLVRALPEEAPLPAFPPPPDLAALGARAPDRRTGEPSSGEPTLAEVRATTAAAVSAAVEAAVAGVTRSAAPAPSAAYARAWDRQREEEARQAARRAASRTDEEWDRRVVERNFFETYLQPCLTPLSRVLEIGAGRDVYTAWTAAEVAWMACVDVDEDSLERARADLEDTPNLGFVRGDGRGLGGFVTGAFDVVLSCEAFRRLDQESIYLHLLEVRRVLRPGGRALLLFANLLDPEGFKAFQTAAQREGERERVSYLTPEAVRTLIEAAGLALESLHLAADDCDLLAILQHEPKLRSTPIPAKESA